MAMIGIYKAVLGTVPAAGAEILDTVPDGVLWRLVAVSFDLSTSVDVATRRVVFVVDTGPVGPIVIRSSANVDQLASLTFRYQGAALGTAPGVIDSATNLYLMPLPPALYLRPGFRLRTVTAGLQVSDQYTQAVYFVEEWPA